MPNWKDGRIRELEAENARLRAVVDKLPKTADGEIVHEGQSIYTPDGQEISVIRVFSGPPAPVVIIEDGKPKWSGCWQATPIEVCYSTREAAEAARKEKE